MTIEIRGDEGTATAELDDVVERSSVEDGQSPWSSSCTVSAAADKGTLGHYRDQNARHRVRVVAAVLDDLAGRGIDLAGCRQADLDRWFDTASDTGRQGLRPFLTWAICTKRMPRLTPPPSREQTLKPISLRERVELLRRVHAGDGMDLTERVIAMLILLYA